MPTNISSFSILPCKINMAGMDKFSGEPESFAELVFGFTEEFVEDSSESSWSCSSSLDLDDDDDESGHDENAAIIEESKAFWKSQEDLLLTTLFRTTSLETKTRQATKEALRDISSVGGVDCSCEKMIGNSCGTCLQKELSNRLRIAGFNCVICKSKWRKSPEIPSGEHSYLEVVQNSPSAKGEMKIIIELNFRAQFEMARANEEYNRLINRLPEVFVGKFGRLQNLVKLLCAASKKCMKERKMHMAPWRKYKYMVAKWHGSPDHPKAAPILSAVSHLDRPARPKASMLTFDLLDSLPGLQCKTMIKVV